MRYIVSMIMYPFDFGATLTTILHIGQHSRAWQL